MADAAGASLPRTILQPITPSPRPTPVLHTIALTLIPGLTLTQQLDILRHCPDVEAVIMHPEDALKEANESSRVPCVKAIHAGRGQALRQAEDELTFCRQHSISILPITSPEYPERLRYCPDAPALLYFRGNADLNARHIVAIVGTRQISEYGKQVCLRLTERLAALLPDILIVSGLAYGVDIHAHRGCLDNGVPTIGVVAHGLDQIYPATHRNDAKRMVLNGGILTEYPRATRPLQGNFLRRNRIVAGMADATIIVESAEHGGSLVTARIAASYGRSVFAVPGRINDTTSIGCNRLIRNGAATPLLEADDLVHDLGWWPHTTAYLAQAHQLELFPTDERAAAPTAQSAAANAHLSSTELLITSALAGTDGLNAAAIARQTGLDIATVNTSLFDMEIDGHIKILPGGLYIMKR